MLAQLLSEPGEIRSEPLRLEERGGPDPGPGELLLAVRACAVCRTDLQIATGDLAARRLPVVPGHQAVGVVTAVGAGVDGWGRGDRAGVGWLASACGECRFCQRAQENLCREATFTGWDRDGGFAEAMTVRADFAIRMPEGFADLEAAPLLCGGVIGYRSLRVSGIEPGRRLGLFGFGASARLAIQVAVHWGCEVHVAARSEADREAARALGATSTGGVHDLPPAPLDAAVTFAPAGEVVIAALRAVDRGGIVAVNAIHLDEIPAFDYDDLWWERQIRSVSNYTRRDAQEFMELAAEIPVRTFTERYELADANAALARVEAGGIEGAVVLEPGRRER